MKYNYLNLTPREIEVSRLIRKGFTSREIGEFLLIARSTVEKHTENIYRKINVGRIDLIDYTDECLDERLLDEMDKM